MTAARDVIRSSTLLRSVALVVVVGLVLLVLSDQISAYRNLQLATGAYYFCVLAGLTVLAGSSGQISLGHGALMAVGAYTVGKLAAHGWALVPELAAAAAVTLIIGIPVGLAASRLRGPYLAGATLAFAVGLPALADRFPTAFGGENGLTVNPPTPPTSLGVNFPLERWQAWIACIGALVVLFVFYNLSRSGVGRALRAVRDDEIAASLAGLRVGRWQTLAFTLSAAAAGLGGGLLAVVTGTIAPGAFPIQLSLTLLAGVVIGGLGSLWGAVWGATLLVFLPNWTTDLANSFSLSTNVSHNLPLAIYGLVLIGAMLAWPTGIQGGFRAIGRWAGPTVAASFGRGGKAPAGIDVDRSAEPPPAASVAADPGEAKETPPDGSVAPQPGPEPGARTPSES
jgi:branched-chain amino acid transport system permease protein